jgi:hypothetical protein
MDTPHRIGLAGKRCDVGTTHILIKPITHALRYQQRVTETQVIAPSFRTFLQWHDSCWCEVLSPTLPRWEQATSVVLTVAVAGVVFPPMESNLLLRSIGFIPCRASSS